VSLLVIGHSGQVAQSLVELARSSTSDIHFAGRPELDLAEPGAVAQLIAESSPRLVINAAAYTAVDRAEAEPDEAMRINGTAVGEIGKASALVGAPVIHLSTDYVFDGSASGAYREDAPIAPINTYGASKAEGERALRDAQPDHLIFRTSWVYSPYGANFIKTMLRLAAERDEVRVVADQRGCPTSAADLAAALMALAEARIAGNSEGWSGTYHLAGEGACSWADFAEHVFAVSRSHGGPSARVIPITTSEFPTPARRPHNSELDCNAAANRLGTRLPPWRESVRSTVEALLGKAP
jgi:dTDP-4-dehydrorhamnose reductase